MLGGFPHHLQAVQRELDELQQQREDANHAMDQLRSAMEERRRTVTDADQAIASKQQESYECGLSLENRRQLEKQQRDKETARQRLQEAVQKAKADIPRLQQRLQKLEEQRKRTQQSHAVQEGELQKGIDQRTRDYQQVEVYSRDVRRYLELRRDVVLQTTREQEQSLKGRIQSERTKYDSLDRELTEKRRVVESKSSIQVQIEANVNYRAGRRKLQELEAERLHLQGKLDQATSHLWAGAHDSGGKDCYAYQEELTKDVQKFDHQYQQLLGREMQLQTQIQEKQQELNGKQYKSITERYNSEVIKMKTLDMASKDLERFPPSSPPGFAPSPTIAIAVLVLACP